MRYVPLSNVDLWIQRLLIAAVSTALAAPVCSSQAGPASPPPSSVSALSGIANAGGGTQKLAFEPLLPSADGPQFVAVSIRPVDMKQDTSGYGEHWAGMHMEMHNQTPEMLVWDATGISNPARVIGLPNRAKASAGGQKYDLQSAADAKLDNLTVAQYRNLVLSILTSRFGLKAHMEMRDEPVWKLTVAKGGLKHVGTPVKREFKDFCWGVGRPGYMKSYDCTFANLADSLGEVDDFEVVDATANSNPHAFELKFDYTANVFTVHGYRNAQPPRADAQYPELYSALPEQLGLKLVKGIAQLLVVVIDHIDGPTEN